MGCEICPRRCGADRSVAPGLCGGGVLPRLAKASLHFGEEPCISGKNGSGTVFFSGCSLGCVFCQNHKISTGNFGKEVSPGRLKEIYRELAARGAHNINLVNPTHWQEVIETSLEGRPAVPFVWNSSGYERAESIRLLEGKIEIYMPDMKYLSEDLAERYSGARDYPRIAKAAIREMFRQRGPYVLGEDGLLKSGVLIRHLVIPGQIEHSFDVIDWVRDSFPKNSVIFSLMTQFTPCGDLYGYPEIDRTLTAEEYERVTDYLQYSGIEDGYTQEMTAAGDELIPDFDLSGI